MLAAVGALGVLDQTVGRLLESATQLWSPLFEPADTLTSHMTQAPLSRLRARLKGGGVAHLRI